MSQNNNLKELVVKAIDNPDFAQELKKNPHATLEKYGIQLSQEELAYLEKAENLEEITSPDGIIIF